VIRQNGLKLVLLPGTDGTGELFRPLIERLPREIECVPVRYPGDRWMSYLDLAGFVACQCPASGPFVLVAESFSTPLAIQIAATRPENLVGLVLCAP
jgi:pimeloyl-[acyl-carrier protein] methyl ester esterase